MSSSNCCFLTCIQVSQEAGQMVWYSHLFQNFPQFIVIHTVKGFGIVNKAEVDVFLELSCLFDDPNILWKLAPSEKKMKLLAKFYLWLICVLLFFFQFTNKKKIRGDNRFRDHRKIIDLIERCIWKLHTYTCITSHSSWSNTSQFFHEGDIDYIHSHFIMASLVDIIVQVFKP